MAIVHTIDELKICKQILAEEEGNYKKLVNNLYSLYDELKANDFKGEISDALMNKLGEKREFYNSYSTTLLELIDYLNTTINNIESDDAMLVAQAKNV